LGAAVVALAWAAPAAATTCFVIVDGLTVIDGPCRFEPFGGDGSFTVSAPYGGYFADVLIEHRGLARGYWNQERYWGHAHADLGRLRRDDACWENAYATVCAW